jgi:SAM-dependent methyltransferase
MTEQMAGGGGYEGSIAELYDYVGPYRARADVTFFVEAAVQAGGPVLEVGCGTGRVLIPTARAGVDVVGLDVSPDMLTVCRQRLRDEPESVQSRVTLVQADMRRFALEQAFTLVTIPFRPFQHLLTVEDQLSCLESIHRHLNNEGLLILDIFNPSLDFLVNRAVGEELAEEPEFKMPDGRGVIRRQKTVSRDRFNQIDDHELIYYVTHPDGREERLVHSFQLRYLFRFEAEHLLDRAGFAVEQLYAGYDKCEYGSRYPGELLFLARKTTPQRKPPNHYQASPRQDRRSSPSGRRQKLQRRKSGHDR